MIVIRALKDGKWQIDVIVCKGRATLIERRKVCRV